MFSFSFVDQKRNAKQLLQDSLHNVQDIKGNERNTRSACISWGGGAPLYELYKYLQPQKCGSLNYFCLTNGSWILPFRLKNRCGSISFHLQMKRREREVAKRDLPLQTCKGEPRLGLKTGWISEARSENESRK